MGAAESDMFDEEEYAALFGGDAPALSGSDERWVAAALAGGACPTARPIESVRLVLAALLGFAALLWIALVVGVVTVLILLCIDAFTSAATARPSRGSRRTSTNLGLIKIAIFAGLGALVLLVAIPRFLLSRLPHPPRVLPIDPRREPRVVGTARACAEALRVAPPPVEIDSGPDVRLVRRRRGWWLALGATGAAAMSQEALVASMIQALAFLRRSPVTTARRLLLGALDRLIAALRGPDRIDAWLAARTTPSWWTTALASATFFARLAFRPAVWFCDLAAALIARDALIDGDRVAARLVGLHAVREQIRVELELFAAHARVEEVLAESLAGGSFPRDFPAFIVAERAKRSAEIGAAVESSMAGTTFGWRDRGVAPARRLAFAEAVAGDAPAPRAPRASSLWREFERTCVNATTHHIEHSGAASDRTVREALPEAQRRVDSRDEAERALVTYLIEPPVGKEPPVPLWPAPRAAPVVLSVADRAAIERRLLGARERLRMRLAAEEAVIAEVRAAHVTREQCRVAIQIQEWGFAHKARQIPQSRSLRRLRRALAAAEEKIAASSGLIEEVDRLRAERLDAALALLAAHDGSAGALVDEPHARTCARRAIGAMAVFAALLESARTLRDRALPLALAEGADPKMGLRLRSPRSGLAARAAEVLPLWEGLQARLAATPDPLGRGRAGVTLSELFTPPPIDESAPLAGRANAIDACVDFLVTSHYLAMGRLASSALRLEHRLLNLSGAPPTVDFSWPAERGADGPEEGGGADPAGLDDSDDPVDSEPEPTSDSDFRPR